MAVRLGPNRPIDAASFTSNSQTPYYRVSLEMTMAFHRIDYRFSVLS
jgi:hypothetical protein